MMKSFSAFPVSISENSLRSSGDALSLLEKDGKGEGLRPAPLRLPPCDLFLLISLSYGLLSKLPLLGSL